MLTAKEPGTLVYPVHAVTDAPLSRVFYECYADEEVFHAHETYPHTRHFLDTKETLISGSSS